MSTQHRIASEGWKHNIVVNNAAYCLGLDIHEPLTHYLASAGYNMVCCEVKNLMSCISVMPSSMWAELFAPPEIYTTIYVYELTNNW